MMITYHELGHLTHSALLHVICDTNPLLMPVIRGFFSGTNEFVWRGCVMSLGFIVSSPLRMLSATVGITDPYPVVRP